MRHHPIGRSTLWRVGSALAVAGVFASCSSRSADDGSSQSSSATLSTTTLPTVPPTTPTQSSDKRTAFEPVAGSRGIGDVLFADLGNPGLDVTHYEVDIAYAPDTGVLAGTVTLSITATEGLAGFSLDAVGLSIGSVSVNGRKARFVVDEPELVITPAVPIADGASFETTVVYTAMPHPQPSATGIPNGWFSTPNGTYVVNEPDGARTWLPSNDHPSDKATYRFTVHVRAGLTGIANGVLESHSVNITDDTWIWNQIDPMATYLIQVITGDYDIIHAVGPHSLVLTSVVHSADRVLMAPFVDGIAGQIAFFEEYFGPFPLATYGIAITDSPSGAAMEEQGRSLFSRDDFVSGQLGGFEQLLLSHELAHQWFGDAVTPASWQDIWLSESFATYGEWMWLDHIGQTSIGTQVDNALLGRQRSSVSTAKPLVESMFDFEVYDGGAVVLHALRLTIGDTAFFELLRTWVAENSGTSRGTNDFMALAERIAGIDLTEFFADWLFAIALPDRLPA